MGVSMGWCSDYPDPYDWINILLYGPSIQAENNVNYSYFNSSDVERPDGQRGQARRTEAPQGLRPA